MDGGRICNVGYFENELWRADEMMLFGELVVEDHVDVVFGERLDSSLGL